MLALLTNDFGSSALRKEPSCHLYNTAVKWKKHEVFLLILEFSWGAAVQIQSSVAPIQPGFLSYTNNSPALWNRKAERASGIAVLG